MEIKKVGVAGCGVMGSGIAQVAAETGHDVVVSELNEECLSAGLARIKANLQRSISKGKITESQMAEALGRIKGGVALDIFKDCDIIIEAIDEKLEAKQKLFRLLDEVCRPDTIFATNTSSLTIIEMAHVTKRQEQFVGLHFFNPVPNMQLAEVITTVSSSKEVVETVAKFTESLNKTVVLARDTPGFIVNRLLVPYLYDAMRVYQGGLATKEDIDNGMRFGCNYPMGPLALADLIGLDILHSIGTTMFEEFKESRFAPPVILKRLVVAGYFGRKTGRGFYDYSDKQ